MAIVGQVIGYVILLALLGPVGNVLIRLVLDISGVPKMPSPPLRPTFQTHIKPFYRRAPTSIDIAGAGRYIGILERLLIVIGILANSWDIIAVVIALKTVARYKELDEQITAEYFLIGSLASILLALIIAGAFHLYDQSIGWHIIPAETVPVDGHPLLQYVFEKFG